MTNKTTFITIPHRYESAIVLGIAFLWWVIALFLRAGSSLNVWTDQQDKFTLAYSAFSDPYPRLSGFFSPPWGVVPLVPFEFPPFPLSVLIQALLYFIILWRIYRRFEGSQFGLWVALTSPFGFDAILELNIDWIASIGLLVPPTLSLPFLAVKPQAIMGYVFTLSRQALLRGIGVLMAVILVSFLFWGEWISKLIDEFGTRSLANDISVAPMNWIPPILSIAIGIMLLIYAFRQEDNVLKILAGYFFTPYLPTYTALIPFLFLCIRYPRFMLFASAVGWGITLFFFVQLLT